MKKALFLATTILSFALCKYVLAQDTTQQPTYTDVWVNMTMANNPDNYSWTYTNYQAKYSNDDGSYVTVTYGNGGGLSYMLRYYNSNNELIGSQDKFTNLALNGGSFPGRTSSVYDQTNDIDSNGRIIATYASAYSGGALLESYKYADNGQMLVYNPQAELIGAYDNWFGKIISQKEFSNKPAKMNHLGTDGNYTVKDSHDNTLETYYQNGEFVKNKYDNKGNIISSNKYDKDGNITESSMNKYDGAGNIVQSYKNGKLIYAKKIYTPAEAAAAVHDGNDNVVSITW